MANLYGLKKFDLNLLVIFECIYQHLSISRAAETLFITPSAVSQSLQRLRTQLNDPLFIRSGKGITPTQMSVNLHYLLEKNLSQLEKTISIANPDNLKNGLSFIAHSYLLPPTLHNSSVPSTTAGICRLSIMTFSSPANQWRICSHSARRI